MSRITIKDVNDLWEVNDTYDLLNRIRNSASPTYQSYVPLANIDNVAEVGAGIQLLSTVQNEFIAALVERIGKVVIHNKIMNNPLKFFKKGKMETGRTIEEVFVDIAEEHLYDPDLAETEVFKREIPDVKTLFHEVNRKGFYKKTVQENSLQQAFTSWSGVSNLITGIINSLYNGNNVDEFEYMKALVDNYDAKGLFTVVPVTPITDESTGKAFIKKVKAFSNRFTFPSRDYNAMAVKTITNKDDQYLLLPSDTEANIEVDVLASAYNMDKVTFAGHYTLVDKFGNPDIQAVLIDRDWFMVYDTLFKMRVASNGQGLYDNYFLHIWQILSTSQFANAVVFKSNTKNEVIKIIVDPLVSSIKAGREMQFTAYVRKTGVVDKPVTWTVEKADGTPVSDTNTKVDANGLLKVGSAENLGSLKVIASVKESDTSTKFGEAIVTVV